ncbi:DNA-directed RNA polymerase subunit beta' [Candidatus Hodgkinia cicadicola]|nr:DNA-directed RNA polymerase subunit beta' [Candidatus Hodgkinia cicadicola]
MIDGFVSPLSSSEQVNSFKISLISPETILSWSYGEVSKPNLFDIKTNKPLIDGLLCPKIFGSNEKENHQRSTSFLDTNKEHKVCNNQFDPNKHLSRSRFGHISLFHPVVHTWYHKTTTLLIKSLTELPTSVIKGIINCELHIVNTNKIEGITKGQIINTKQLEEIWNRINWSEICLGGNAIRYLISKSNLNQLRDKYTKAIKNPNLNSKQANDNLKIINWLNTNRINPKWIILDILPVLPLSLRPIITIDDNTVASSDLNDLYKQVLIANNSMEHLINNTKLGIKTNHLSYLDEVKHLQTTVDALIDGSGQQWSKHNYNNTALKSFTDILKGKTGRFRKTILGKRVDYSGRSVIVPGPELKINEFGLPIAIALELFKPFICSKLMLNFKLKSIREAESMIKEDKVTTNLLHEVINFYPMILNRAPTLHKLSIQAFYAKLTNIKAIRIHPLVCSGFNADFDGDQMAIHVPLTISAITEATALMISTQNIFHPSNGEATLIPTQEIVMGLYYMSLVSNKSTPLVLTSYSEVHKVLLSRNTSLHDKIKFTVNINNKIKHITTTMGRLLITEIIPKELDFIYTTGMPELTKTKISDLIEAAFKTCNKHDALKLCETLMKMGFKYSSLSGISLSSHDLTLKSKSEIIKKYKKHPNLVITNTSKTSTSEYKSKVYKISNNILTTLSSNVETYLNDINNRFNPMQIMVNSGARGTLSQTKQLMGARGYTTDPDGNQSKIPILSSYNDGLSLNDFLSLTFEARKGLVDTVLNTSSSGYLTRKLVESTRDYIINTYDCKTNKGILVNSQLDHNIIKQSLIGRTSLNTIKIGNKTIIEKNELITDNNIQHILFACNNGIYIRSPITCTSKTGICVLCYGLDLNYKQISNIGTTVGILAAQSISEPGTQLTLRTFHGQNTLTDRNETTSTNEIPGIAPCSGQVNISNLACVYTSFGDVISTTHNCSIAIYQNTRKVWSTKIPRGYIILIRNGEHIDKDKLIYLKHPYPVSYLSLAVGLLTVKDAIYYINTKKPIDIITNTPTDNLHFNTSKIQPIICLVVKNIKLKWTCKTNIELALKTGQTINIFDIITKSNVHNEISIPYDNEEKLDKLNKLFDSNLSSDTSLIIPTTGILKLGHKTNNTITYILEPNDRCNHPQIYEVINYQGLPTFANRTGRNIYRGQILISGEIDLNQFIINFGFDRLIEYFINKIQTIYTTQGININNKHIEVVLAKMTETAVVIKTGLTPDENNKVLWKKLELSNHINGNTTKEQTTYERCITGTTKLCENRLPLLSSIAFQGSAKKIALAAIQNITKPISSISDCILLGKTANIGPHYSSV